MDGFYLGADSFSLQLCIVMPAYRHSPRRHGTNGGSDSGAAAMGILPEGSTLINP